MRGWVTFSTPSAGSKTGMPAASTLLAAAATSPLPCVYARCSLTQLRWPCGRFVSSTSRAATT